MRHRLGLCLVILLTIGSTAASAQTYGSALLAAPAQLGMAGATLQGPPVLSALLQPAAPLSNQEGKAYQDSLTVFHRRWATNSLFATTGIAATAHWREWQLGGALVAGGHRNFRYQQAALSASHQVGKAALGIGLQSNWLQMPMLNLNGSLNFVMGARMMLRERLQAQLRAANLLPIALTQEARPKAQPELNLGLNYEPGKQWQLWIEGGHSHLADKNGLWLGAGKEWQNLVEATASVDVVNKAAGAAVRIRTKRLAIQYAVALPANGYFQHSIGLGISLRKRGSATGGGTEPAQDDHH